MECSKCHLEVPDNAKFCLHCGCNLIDLDGLRERCLVDTKACEHAITQGDSSRPYMRQHFHTRLPEWKHAAELGIREAQWLLARCYDEGFGVEKNEIHAISWHLKAAEQGYSAAQNHIGSCYQNGQGLPRDEAEAVQWYRKAAEQGYTVAQSNLGWCCDTGTGVASDEAEAVRWYRKAAEQGEDTAQFNLGVHHEWGSGVPQDKTEAVKWYRKAADHGYEQADQALKRLQEELAETEIEKQEKDEDAELRFRTVCKEALADGKLTIDEKKELKALAKSLQISKELGKQIFEQEKEVFLRGRKVQHTREAKLKFHIACKNALADGKITPEEQNELRELAKSLKIPKELVKHILEQEKKIFQASQKVQPTKAVEIQFRQACKKVLADGKVTPEEKDHLKGLARFFKMPNEVMKQILTDEVRIFRQSQKLAVSKNVELQFRKACKDALADGKVTPQEERQLKDLAKFFKMPNPTMKQILADEVEIYRKTHPKATRQQ